MRSVCGKRIAGKLSRTAVCAGFDIVIDIGERIPDQRTRDAVDLKSEQRFHRVYGISCIFVVDARDGNRGNFIVNGRSGIDEILQNDDVFSFVSELKENERPLSPGMKYRHYAPQAEMTLVEGAMEQVVEFINQDAKLALEAGLKVGIICTEESRESYQCGILKVIGSRENEESVAHNLFAVLREFDDQKVDCIFSESFSKDRLGQAIMNRLCKAAGYHIVKV